MLLILRPRATNALQRGFEQMVCAAAREATDRVCVCVWVCSLVLSRAEHEESTDEQNVC